MIDQEKVRNLREHCVPTQHHQALRQRGFRLDSGATDGQTIRYRRRVQFGSDEIRVVIVAEREDPTGDGASVTYRGYATSDGFRDLSYEEIDTMGDFHFDGARYRLPDLRVDPEDEGRELAFTLDELDRRREAALGPQLLAVG